MPGSAQLEAALSNFSVPPFMLSDLPFWFEVVDRACTSRGVETLEVRKEVIMNRMPPGELSRCKDFFSAGHWTYSSLTRALTRRLMPSWEDAMEAIAADQLGDRMPSDMLRAWSGWVDVDREARHLKYQFLSKMPEAVFPNLKLRAEEMSLTELAQAADRIMPSRGRAGRIAAVH